MKKINIVADTNIWVSLLLTGQLIFAVNFLANPLFCFLACQNLLNEISKVIRRPKFKKYISENDAVTFEAHFTKYTMRVNVKTSVKGVCRDENDDFLFALAQEGNADYLITGDKDLLIIGNYKGTKIISLREFKENVMPIL